MRQEPVVDPLIVGKAVHQDCRRVLAGDLADEDAALGGVDVQLVRRRGAVGGTRIWHGGISLLFGWVGFLVYAVRRLPGRKPSAGELAGVPGEGPSPDLEGAVAECSGVVDDSGVAVVEEHRQRRSGGQAVRELGAWVRELVVVPGGQCRSLSMMRNMPRAARAAPAMRSAASRQRSPIRLPSASPSWEASRAWMAMAVITAATGRRVRPRLKPMASSSVLMARPREMTAMPRLLSRAWALPASLSSSAMSIQAPTAMSAAAAR